MIDELLVNHKEAEVKQIARHDSFDVIITGPPGTGKSRLGKEIHCLSPRKDKPFIEVNCAQFSPTLIEAELFGAEKGSFTGAIAARVGKFEAATGGTLFLDEIGEFTFDLQAKLLKAIEEKQIMRLGSNTARKVDVRLIFATNQPLERFREDFKHRLLCAYPFRLRPLSERRDESPPLIAKFIKEMSVEMNRQFAVRPDICQQLQARRWSGNIRELRGTIRRLCVKAMIAAPAEQTRLEIKLESEGFENAAEIPAMSSRNDGDSNLQSAHSSSLSEGLLRLYRREDQLFARAFLREQESLRARGLSVEQMADAMGIKRRTFFYRLKRSREILAEDFGEIDGNNICSLQAAAFHQQRSSSDWMAA